jgi:hypothetical protein
MRGEMGAFYLVFGPMELSAGLGYTTGGALLVVNDENFRAAIHCATQRARSAAARRASRARGLLKREVGRPCVSAALMTYSMT